MHGRDRRKREKEEEDKKKGGEGEGSVSGKLTRGSIDPRGSRLPRRLNRQLLRLKNFFFFFVRAK